MAELELLRPGTLYKLDQLGTTPGAPAWVSEVEEFIRGPGPLEAWRGGGRVLLILEEGSSVGAAIHRPHPSYDARLLSALLIGHLHRGRGLATAALEAVTADAHAAAPGQVVMWLVHEENVAMRRVSERVAHGPPHQDGEYLVFFHDP